MSLKSDVIIEQHGQSCPQKFHNITPADFTQTDLLQLQMAVLQSTVVQEH